MKIIAYIILIYSFGCCVTIRVSKKVPKKLQIGAGTSSYQVEGAWDDDGKGENIWDRLTHTNPRVIIDGSNGDVACDSYHKIKTDVAMLKSVGFQYYRFSISWARILPNGVLGPINSKGVAYYNRLINKLLANDIEPVITIYHWDHPQVLQDQGGWTSPKMVKWFKDYAGVIFALFGDRVNLWITINEPNQIIRLCGVNSFVPPGIKPDGFGEYLCVRHILLAHATVYRLYEDKYGKERKGRVSLALDAGWMEPSSNSTADIDAAERGLQFALGIYAQPIFGEKGDFPSVVKEVVAALSAGEGLNKSRLPEFTKQEISFIRGTADFFALNYYTSFYATDTIASVGLPSKDTDNRVYLWQDPNWLTGSFDIFRSVPWGFRKLLKYIKDSYGNPKLYITENGFPDVGEINDEKRLTYLRTNLAAMLDAIHEDGVRIKGYTLWSLMDNWEWINGYAVRFGTFHVNFTDPDRRRTPKLTSEFFKTLIDTRRLIYDE